MTGQPWLPKFNGNEGVSQDYRGLLVARITAKYTPSDGPFAGRPVYEWIEQSISAAGGDEDSLSPRKGTYTSSTQFDNVLVDPNDTNYAIDQFVWARMKGATGGSTIYETVSGGAGNVVNADGSSCSSDAWLKWVSVATDSCWTFYHRGGDGRCACFPTEDPFDSTAGITAMYSAETGIEGWIGVAGNSSGGSGMIRSCCGCGAGIMKINPGAATGSKATFTLNGIHVSCDTEGSGSGSGGTAMVFTETLTDYCTGILKDGRRYILFFGSSADVCSGNQTGCSNEYRIMAVCGAPCIDSDCCDDCFNCGDYERAVAFVALGITDFTNNTYNGSWVWTRNTLSCGYTASCGASSTISFVPASGSTAALWRLTHGPSVYELSTGVAQPFGCCVTNDMERVSGTDGPTTITLVPVGCKFDKCEWDITDLPTSLRMEAIAATGAGTSLLGVVRTITRTPPSTIYVSGSSVVNPCTGFIATMGMSCGPGFGLTAGVELGTGATVNIAIEQLVLDPDAFYLRITQTWSGGTPPCSGSITWEITEP